MPGQTVQEHSRFAQGGGVKKGSVRTPHRSRSASSRNSETISESALMAMRRNPEAHRRSE